MAKDSQKQNLSAAYELLKQWTDIGDADSYEQLGRATVYKTSVVLWLMLLWPIAHVVLAHELSSGAAMPPEIGAMYGQNAISETRLAQTLIKRLPPKSIIMADAGFGIFSTAYHAKLNGHNFVLRLKKDRFNRIRKSAELVSSTERSKSYRVDWLPSPSERGTNPDIPLDCAISTMIHELKISDESLYIAENLGATSRQLRDLFWKRNDIEIDIRNIKVVIDTEEIRVQSKEMFLKEFALSMVEFESCITSLVGGMRRWTALVQARST